MSAIVFLGPSLDVAAARAILPALYLPPASLGDVYSAARRRPRAIAIIDGYFDRVPSVWHKEILWAIKRGVRVYGASSMGALRAAEVDAYGMIGVGQVYEAFRDGTLEDDDEVALMHAPHELGYASGSEAMVNIRATFAAAHGERVITRATHDLLVVAAKSAYYPDRNYERAVLAAEQRGAPPQECAALRQWLVTGRRDVKRDDAVALLMRVAADLEQGGGPAPAAFTFNATTMWEELRKSIDRRPLDDSPGVEMGLEDDVLDELRLQRDRYIQERARALARLLAIELGYQQGTEPAPLAQHLVEDSIRDAQQLNSIDDVHDWLVSQGLMREGIQAFLEEEAQARGVTAAYTGLMRGAMRDHLRATGRYRELSERAQAKQRLLWRRGQQNPGLASAGVSEAGLWQWFFGTLGNQATPADLSAAARELDFVSVDLMRRAALREYLYRGMHRQDESAMATVGDHASEAVT